MSLTTRLSIFFLGTLAFVLVGFSVTLYVLAHNYLYRQIDDRLEAVLNTLAASADVGPEGVEWEPRARRLSFGQDFADDQVGWVVRDNHGNELERSGNLSADLGAALRSTNDRHQTDPLARAMPGWRVSRRRVELGPTDSSSSTVQPPRQEAQEKRQLSDPEQKYQALIITAGTTLAPVQATLRNLALSLACISLALWLVAVLAGRWVCRRALDPLSRMATAARTMSAAALDQRLPQPETGDELAELSAAFNELLNRLQESFERQRRFTGDASHQLRTPLTAMLGQVEVALRRPRSGEEYERVLTLVQHRVIHLRQIVEMLLFLARANVEDRLPDRRPLDVEEWLAEHLRSWEDSLRAHDLRLERSGSGRRWIDTNPPLLGQLVDNLLENACKYSDAGTPISLRVRDEQDAIVLSVEDAGSGIAEEDQPHIFEPFYRSAELRSNGHGGIGLGLAVAKRIATALGGTITVRSQLRKGSQFDVRLPRLP